MHEQVEQVQLISLETSLAKKMLSKKIVKNYEDLKRQIRPTDKQIRFARAALADLAGYERSIVEFHFWNNYSVSEIAYIFGLPKTLIKRLLDEAIHKLRLSYLIEFSAPKDKVENRSPEEVPM